MTLITKKIRDLLSDVVQECRNNLDHIRPYLLKRQIHQQEIIDKFQLGYLPETKSIFQCLKSKWDADEALQLATSIQLLSKVKNQEKTYISLLSNRLIFPIFDIYGRMIGLSGRSLTEDIKPKYFNTKFNKGNHLYGFNLAKRACLKKNNIFVVEGYMDVIAGHKAGTENIVGAMGVALNPCHTALIARYTNNASLMMDNDRAGQESTQRFLEKHKPNKLILNIKTNCLPEKYKDLDEFVSNDITEADKFLKK